MKTLVLRVHRPRGDQYWKPNYVTVAIPGITGINVCKRAALKLFGEMPDHGKTFYKEIVLADGTVPKPVRKSSPQ